MSTDSPPAYDLVMVADLRQPAEVSTSLPDEITVQAEAGFSTALVDLPRDPSTRVRPVHPRLRYCIRRGWADLLYGDHRAHGRLLVVRDPGLFGNTEEHDPRVSGEVRVVVADRSLADPSPGTGADTLRTSEAALTRLFGAGFTWAPVDPLVRDTLTRNEGVVSLASWDWSHTIDAERWRVVRPGLAGRRPVIGGWVVSRRGGRPARAGELLAVCPLDSELEVEVVTDAQPPPNDKRLPGSWRVHSLASSSLAQLLARVDFFVLLHEESSDAESTRIPLEALATGAVPVLPQTLGRVFGDAGRYGARELATSVGSFLHDPQAHDAQVEHGRQLTRQRFGPEVHAQRLASLIGPPPERVKRHAHDGTQARRACPVLFISSNGVGMGHLTRLMAMARRASPATQPVFLTASQAVAPVRAMGFPCEYVPGRAHLGGSGAQWNHLLHRRINEIITHLRPRAVVFDGTSPYAGLLRARADHPRLPFVWSRRAMWQEGKSEWAVAQGDAFDRVIEPGEVAADYDHGRTVPARGAATVVSPVTLLDAEELLDSREARTALGLDPDRPAALIHLGAGNLNDIAPIADAMVQAFDSWPHLQICFTSAVIAERDAVPHSGVTALSVHPISRYLRAFDVAASAAGYNSFHELLRAGVPTIFVPNTRTQLDDQVARARYAHDHGFGRLLEDPRDAADLVAALRDEQLRDEMRRQCAAADVGNGAADAMAAIENLAVPRVEDLSRSA